MARAFISEQTHMSKRHFVVTTATAVIGNARYRSGDVLWLDPAIGEANRAVLREMSDNEVAEYQAAVKRHAEEVKK